MGDVNDPTENVTLYDENGNAVELILTGGIYRLAVDADITGGNFQLQPFTPKFDFSVASIALNTSTDTSLKSVTSTTGKIDFIAIAGSNSNYEIVLKIDG